MARIRTYSNDPQITGADKFVGTDAMDNSTKNFTIDALAEYYIRTGAADPDRVGFQFVLNPRPFRANTAVLNGQAYYRTTGGTGFAQVTSIIVSQFTTGGVDFTPATSILENTILKLTDLESVNNNNYGYFNVQSVNTSIPNAFELIVFHESSVGSLPNSLVSLTPTSINANIVTNGILSGSASPVGNQIATLGSFYVQTGTSPVFFGPKTTDGDSLGWGDGVSLVGPTGATGANSTVPGPAGTPGAAGTDGMVGAQGQYQVSAFGHFSTAPITFPVLTFDGTTLGGTDVLDWSVTTPSTNSGATTDTLYLTQVFYNPATGAVTGAWSLPSPVAGSVAGPAGIPGPVGPMGTAGSTGAAGTDGTDGTDGATGAAGAQGEQGMQGGQGETGDTGAAGADSTVAGPQGDTGDTGTQGIQGFQGSFRLEVFIRSSTAPTTPVATSYSTTTDAFTGLSTGWSQTIPAGTEQLYEAFTFFDPSDSSLTLFSVPFIAGAQGPAGVAGAMGTAGVDGDAGRAIVSITAPANPGVQGATDTYTVNYSLAPLTTTFDIINGADGAVGAVGNGIASNVYDAATGILTITFTDGTTFATTDLRGSTGAAGTDGTNGTTTFTTAVQLAAAAGVDVSAFADIQDGDLIIVTTGVGVGNVFLVGAFDGTSTPPSATLTAAGNIRGATGTSVVADAALVGGATVAKSLEIAGVDFNLTDLPARPAALAADTHYVLTVDAAGVPVWTVEVTGNVAGVATLESLAGDITLSAGNNLSFAATGQDIALTSTLPVLDLATDGLFEISIDSGVPTWVNELPNVSIIGALDGAAALALRVRSIVYVNSDGQSLVNIPTPRGLYLKNSNTSYTRLDDGASGNRSAADINVGNFSSGTFPGEIVVQTGIGLTTDNENIGFYIRNAGNTAWTLLSRFVSNAPFTFQVNTATLTFTPDLTDNNFRGSDLPVRFRENTGTIQGDIPVTGAATAGQIITANADGDGLEWVDLVAGTALSVQEEGTAAGTVDGITKINFIGAGVLAEANATDPTCINVTVTGGTAPVGRFFTNAALVLTGTRTTPGDSAVTFTVNFTSPNPLLLATVTSVTITGDQLPVGGRTIGLTSGSSFNTNITAGFTPKSYTATIVGTDTLGDTVTITATTPYVINRVAPGQVGVTLGTLTGFAGITSNANRFLERYDGGSIPFTTTPAAPGSYTAGVVATTPVASPLVVAAENTAAQSVIATETLTLTGDPDITRTTTVALPVQRSVRFGSVAGTVTAFTDDATAVSGLRSLSDFGIQYGVVNPVGVDAGFNSNNGDRLYIVVEAGRTITAARSDLFPADNIFPEFAAPVTIAGYDIYLTAPRAGITQTYTIS